MPWIGIARDSVTWHGEKPTIYKATVGESGVCISERFLCGNCGSNIAMWYYLYPNKVHVAAGTMIKSDFDLPKEVEMHIWIKQAPSWYDIPKDGVRRFEEFDGEFEKRLNQYLEEHKKQG